MFKVRRGGRDVLLELAEDVSVLSGNVGCLQHGHTKGENIPDLQMLHRHIHLPIQSRLHCQVVFITASCHQSTKINKHDSTAGMLHYNGVP